MYRPRQFLVVVDDDECLFLIAKTLGRSFPRSTVVEHATPQGALEYVSSGGPAHAAIIQLSSFESQLATVRRLRQKLPTIPILVLTEFPGLARPSLIKAGATRVQPAGEWLLAGVTTLELLRDEVSRKHPV